MMGPEEMALLREARERPLGSAQVRPPPANAQAGPLMGRFGRFKTGARYAATTPLGCRDQRSREV